MVLGVNIHWIPKRSRAEFIANVDEIMGKTVGVGKKRERMRLFYTLLRKPKFRVGMEAIRLYYISHMSAIQEIARPKWNIVLGISSKFADIRYKKDGYEKKTHPNPVLK